MKFDFDGSLPIFQQIAEQISEAILTGSFPEGTQIPSTTEVSRSFQINPATVLKGMNLLVDQELLEKRRGIGMFVTIGAKEKILEQRKDVFFHERLAGFLHEAKNLGITQEQLVHQIERGYDHESTK